MRASSFGLMKNSVHKLQTTNDCHNNRNANPRLAYIQTKKNESENTGSCGFSSNFETKVQITQHIWNTSHIPWRLSWCNSNLHQLESNEKTDERNEQETNEQTDERTERENQRARETEECTGETELQTDPDKNTPNQTTPSLAATFQSSARPLLLP